MPSDLASVTTVLASTEQLEETVRTMLLEGLPHAAKEGCGHRYQKEFMSLAGNALEGSKQSVTEALTAIEADLKAAEGELEAIKVAEADAARATEEAAEALANAQVAADEAKKIATIAEKEHAQAEKAAEAFLRQRKEDQEECSRVAAIVEGSLRVLVDGGWADEEGKAGAVEATEELLGQIGADKVLVAAAPHALGEKPDSRSRFDTMAIDAVSKGLNNHLAGLQSNLQESDAEEVDKQAEILGLWAIADCARDSSAAAAASSDGAKEKHAVAEMELDAGRKRARAQQKEFTERSNKRSRVMAQLAEVDEAMAAATRLSEGAPEVAEAPAAEIVEEPAEAVV